MSALKIPPELQEADRLLTQYGRWAMDRFRRQHCGSAEHLYKPAGDIEARREPLVPLMPDFRAMDVQRALNEVPLQYRRVLQAEYIPQRVSLAVQRRILKLSPRTWEGTHLVGLRMFANLWRTVKKTG
jgi:hypothetical protein